MKKQTQHKAILLSLVNLLIIWNCTIATGQNDEWTVYNYSTTSYRNMTVSDMLVDHEGNLWVAGNNLKKYDGTRWTVYTFENNSDRTYLAVDSQNHLWVSTFCNFNPPLTDLFEFDGTSWIEHNGYKEKLPTMGAITGLAIDENDIIWLGTDHKTNYFDEGILRYDKSEWTLFDATNSPLPDSTAITSVASDSTGGVWFGTWWGILKHCDGTWNFFNEQNTPLTANFSPSYIDVSTDGRIWFAMPGRGLKAYDGSQWYAFPLYGGNSRGIGIDHLNRIWTGGDNGTYVFVDETWHSGSEIISDYSDILPGTKTGWSGFCSVSDHSENIWLTGGGELISFDPVSGEILFDSREPQGLPSGNRIYDIAFTSDGTAWIATHQGLASYDGVFWNTYSLNNSILPTSMIYCLAIDSNDVVWVGTENGLVKIDGEDWAVYTTGNSVLPSDPVKHIAVDSQNTVWLATDQPGYLSSLPPGYGIVSFDGIDWNVYTTDNSGIPDNRVSALAIDTDDNIWVGSSLPYHYSAYYSNGIAKFDGSEWEVFNSDNSGLGCDKVTDIAIADDGAVWASTFEYQETWNGDYIGGGLYCFKNGVWQSYTTDNTDLLSNSIALVTADSRGTIWLGYKDELGVSSFDGEKWELIQYSENGLPSNFVSCVTEAPVGDLWIGTFPQSGDSFVRIDGIGVYTPPDSPVSVTDDKHQPTGFEIATLTNYPNPFNPKTTISFGLPEKAHVSIKIFDILGRNVRTLMNNTALSAGWHNTVWDSRDDTGIQVSSGLYFCRILAGETALTQKLTLIR